MMKPTCKASLNTTELASSAKLNTDENDATIIDQDHSHIYVGSTYLSGRQVRPIKNNYFRMKRSCFAHTKKDKNSKLSLLTGYIIFACVKKGKYQSVAKQFSNTTERISESISEMIP